MKKNYIVAIALLVIVLVIDGVTGSLFLKLREPDQLLPSANLTKQMMLSDYFDQLEGTNGDTPIYVFEGNEPGGKILVLGGTHPNEPSGYMTAVMMVEKLQVDKGTVYVIPRANNSAFTHNDPQEGSPLYYHFETPSGTRAFRFGSRASNPVDQWPDPDIYIHASSGQRLSGSETRNLNRAYPGKVDGTLTEQIAYGIVQLINEEQIGLMFDLHEASPEYPVINATVSHDKGMDIASVGVMNLQFEGIPMTLEPSPVNLRGLTHRELGDFTEVIPLLMETANASQGRLRGKTNEELALTGKDKFYVSAAKLGMIYVPYNENGHPIEERVGRHMQGIVEFTKAFSEKYPEQAVEFGNVPTYDQLIKGNLGDYLG